MSNKRKSRLLIDMDGTTFDLPEKLAASIDADHAFPESFRKTISDMNNRSTHEIWTLFEDESQHNKIKNMIQNIYQKKAFFASLEPYPGVVDTIKSLSEHYTIKFCTSPSKKACGSESEKRKTIIRYFGEYYNTRINQSFDKTEVRGDILIDDTPTVTIGDYTPEWQLILMNRPSNQHITGVPRVFLNKQAERGTEIANVLANNYK